MVWWYSNLRSVQSSERVLHEDLWGPHVEHKFAHGGGRE